MQEFRCLVDRYQGAVHALSYRILRRREDAEDAAQDTFICVYKSLHTYRESGAFWSWLRRITVNCCLKRIPREVPSDEVETMIDINQPCVDSVAAEYFRRCDLETIQEAIADLPVNYRTVVVLRYQEDLALTEIAQLLNERDVTVRVRLHRAIKMLTDRLVVNEHAM